MRAGFTVLALLVLAGCWKDGPGPAPAPLRPEPTSPEPEKKSGPRWRQSTNVAVGPPADQPRTTEQIAHQLAVELHTSGATLLPSYVAGPIVVLDLDTGALTTECGSAASTGAQTWGAMLNGPARPLAHCRGGQTITCHQFSMPQILIVEFADPDQWRIVSVIVGNFRTGRTAMSSKMSQMRSQIANAACP